MTVWCSYHYAILTYVVSMKKFMRVILTLSTAFINLKCQVSYLISVVKLLTQFKFSLLKIG
uniref:Uncharacterized protein n=1 Tax=Octopus bimaculoides TaxID=37653 RepID=A0A0L8H4U2_OCTBM